MKKRSTSNVKLRRQAWQPVLTREISRRALEVVNDIVAALPGPSEMGISDPLLSSGTAGIAILCAYLSRAGLDDDENAREFLAHSVNAVPELPLGPSLYGGFTGIAWATEHLQHQLLDLEDDPNQSIDAALKSYLDQSPWRDDYDLIIGLVGIGVYALERLPRPSARECIELIVDRLDETAVRGVDGVTWLTRPELLFEKETAKFPNGYYNLGLAHGLPGVIALLGQICAAGIALPKARKLLHGSVAWLLRHKATGPSESHFLGRLADSVNESGTCRLAWCYGDAGVAAALMVAARCVGEETWEREALAIARSAAARNPETAGVTDAGICHGAAGLGHIFNRFFQATGEVTFRRAARFWIERTLELRRTGQGIAGYSAYRDTNDDGEEYWEDRVGILEGAAGVALALLAAATGVEPEWDRMLLVSILLSECEIKQR